MSAVPQSVPRRGRQRHRCGRPREWLDALSAVIASEGGERAHFLLEQLIDEARQHRHRRAVLGQHGLREHDPGRPGGTHPGNIEIEERLRTYMRWNAMAMVVKANRLHPADGGDLGGTSRAFQSVATMFGAGFNHFWHAETPEHGGDLPLHPGPQRARHLRARLLEGRISEEQLLNFRQEVGGKGISSYPHPKLMPDFWQFPTVSMGLGPLMAIYQARFLKYLHARGIADTSPSARSGCSAATARWTSRRAWVPSAWRRARSLDNLIFVVNCNLQRLDGPVRGNGKIIQELESEFRGRLERHQAALGQRLGPAAGARDKDGAAAQGDDGHRRRRLPGDQGQRRRLRAQSTSSAGPEAAGDGRQMSDDDIWRLNRGGHDPQKVYAAFHRAVQPRRASRRCCSSRPSRASAWARAARARTPRTRPKKLSTRTSAPSATASTSRSRTTSSPTSRSQSRPTTRPRCATCTNAARRSAATCRTAARKADEQLPVPPLETFKAVLEPTAEGREISTTQAYVRFLTQLLRDKALGRASVPILSTRRAPSAWRACSARSASTTPQGQKYTPVDKDQVMYYREDKRPDPAGRHQRAGGMSSWIAAATSYRRTTASWCRSTSTTRCSASSASATWPGPPATCSARLPARRHQRAHHAQRRGPAARDGHSHILAGTIPNCISYDPTFAHEVAVILHHGLRMVVEQQDNVFYYLTLLNENYPMPGLKPGTGADHQGMYLLQRRRQEDAARQPAGQRHDPARVDGRARNCWEPTGAWRPTSGAARASTSWRATARTPSAGTCCTRRPGRASLRRAAAGQTAARWSPATDYMKNYAEQIRAFHAQRAALQGAGHRRLRPQRLPQSCASTSRSTATTSSWPRSRRSPTRAPCPRPRWPRRSRSTASPPTRSTPVRPERIGLDPRHRRTTTRPRALTPDTPTETSNHGMVEVKVPTSATSRTWRSSNCWSSPATRWPPSSR